jgi:hypothetical protein
MPVIRPQLKAADVPEMAGARLFSIDGGHTAAIVASDMALAEDCLASGGVVIADDVFNPQWPDVCTGTLNYLQEGKLVPFAIRFNKTLFTQPSYATGYRTELVDHYARQYLTMTLDGKSFGGHTVAVLVRVPRTPGMLAWRSATARRVVRSVRATLAR